jgi:hypothetical protein
MAGGRIIWTVDPIPIELSRPNLRKIDMPDLIRAFSDWKANHLTIGVRCVKQAQFNLGRIF